MKHTFKKPYNFEGQDFEELEVPLDSLTGKDLSIAKSQWALAGNFSPMPSTDLDYCAAIAARASKQPIEFFEQMPAREFNKITQAVSNFLNE